MSRMLYVKWHFLEKGRSMTYSYRSGAMSYLSAISIFGIENLARVDVFQTALQCFMSVVQMGTFIDSDTYIHKSSDACNSIAGFHNFSILSMSKFKFINIFKYFWCCEPFRCNFFYFT